MGSYERFWLTDHVIALQGKYEILGKIIPEFAAECLNRGL